MKPAPAIETISDGPLPQQAISLLAGLLLDEVEAEQTSDEVAA